MGQLQCQVCIYLEFLFFIFVQRIYWFGFLVYCEERRKTRVISSGRYIYFRNDLIIREEIEYGKELSYEGKYLRGFVQSTQVCCGGFCFIFENSVYNKDLGFLRKERINLWDVLDGFLIRLVLEYFYFKAYVWLFGSFSQVVAMGECISQFQVRLVGFFGCFCVFYVDLYSNCVEERRGLFFFGVFFSFGKKGRRGENILLYKTLIRVELRGRGGELGIFEGWRF